MSKNESAMDFEHDLYIRKKGSEGENKNNHLI